MAKRKIGPIEISADRVVVALIDRLIQVEKKYDALKKEVETNFEMSVEYMPRMTEDGQLKFLACSADVESSEMFDVTVQPASSVARPSSP